MRSTARLALAAAGLAVLGVAGSSHAATKPTALVFTDGSGDGVVDGDDIAKVTFTTKGTTKKVGRTVVYTPTTLLMSVQTVGPISSDGYLQYNVQGTLPGCGEFYLGATPGSALDPMSAGCPDDDTLSFAGASYAVAGNMITFSVPFKTIPQIKAGAVIQSPKAYVGTVDPVTGELGPSFFFVANDDAESAKPYKIG